MRTWARWWGVYVLLALVVTGIESGEWRPWKLAAAVSERLTRSEREMTERLERERLERAQAERQQWEAAAEARRRAEAEAAREAELDAKAVREAHQVRERILERLRRDERWRQALEEAGLLRPTLPRPTPDARDIERRLESIEERRAPAPAGPPPDRGWVVMPPAEIPRVQLPVDDLERERAEVNRRAEDEERARRLEEQLARPPLQIPRNGRFETDVVPLSGGRTLHCTTVCSGAVCQQSCSAQCVGC